MDSFTKCDIFTPDIVGEYMASFLSGDGTLLEPSVGKGNLLRHVNPEDYERIDVYDIKKDYLDSINLPVNKHHMDFLEDESGTMYKNIIMNPPYIRFQDLQDDYRKRVSNVCPELLKGNFDIYYAFIIKCMQQLTMDGVMVVIVPNALWYTKSGKLVKDWLIENRYIRHVKDYGSEKVFENVSVYTFILVLDKKPKKSYTYNEEIIQYDELQSDNKHVLGNFVTVSVGVATLRDKIFIHDKKLFEEPCWKPIESANKSKWIIYPYDSQGQPLDEEVLKTTCPDTFNYLLENKDELAKRDKGKKSYPRWFCWGRTQSILPCEGECLLLPTLMDPNNMEAKVIKNSLWWNSLCIKSKNPEMNIKEILKTSVKFIEKHSPKRGSGWISLSSSVIKSIPLP